MTKETPMVSLKRFTSEYAARTPDRRKLNIYAADPMSGRRPRFRTTIDINHEPLLVRGPSGAVIDVVDYDAEHKQIMSERELVMRWPKNWHPRRSDCSSSHDARRRKAAS
jgi:hypothetical protein